MAIPVIIPAYNEAARLGATLASLPSHEIEPIVAVNGSTDQTAAVAEYYGVDTYVFEEQGKLPAIQRVLQTLGERSLEPIIILDADTKPIFPRAWQNGFKSLLESTSGPTVIGGPIVYTGKPRPEAMLRTLYRAGRAAQYVGDTTLARSVQFGPNMAIKLDTAATFDAVQELPNFWPSEDLALAQTILDQEGTYIGSVNPKLLALTPTSVSAISLYDRLKLGAVDTKRVVAQRYVERGAPTSRPYVPEP